jgi:hypothetical protein
MLRPAGLSLVQHQPLLQLLPIVHIISLQMLVSALNAQPDMQLLQMAKDAQPTPLIQIVESFLCMVGVKYATTVITSMVLHV